MKQSEDPKVPFDMIWTISTTGIQSEKRDISEHCSGPAFELSLEMTDLDIQIGKHTRNPNVIGLHLTSCCVIMPGTRHIY